MDIERIIQLRRIRDEIDRMIDEETDKVGQSPLPVIPYTPTLPTVPYVPTYPIYPTYPTCPPYIITWCSASSDTKGYL